MDQTQLEAIYKVVKTAHESIDLGVSEPEDSVELLNAQSIVLEMALDSDQPDPKLTEKLIDLHVLIASQITDWHTRFNE